MTFVPRLNARAPDASAAPDAPTGPVLSLVNPMVLKLSQSLQTHKGMMRELTFRTPVGRDYISIGALPFDVRGGAEDRRIVLDYAKTAKWISALTDIDEILVGNMPRVDFLAASERVNDILMGEGIDKMGNSGG
jgi:hypothetical protein